MTQPSAPQPEDPIVYACPDGFYLQFALHDSGRLAVESAERGWIHVGDVAKPDGGRCEFKWTRDGLEEPEYRRDRWRTATYVGISAKERAASTGTV